MSFKSPERLKEKSDKNFKINSPSIKIGIENLEPKEKKLSNIRSLKKIARGLSSSIEKSKENSVKNNDESKSDNLIN